jgi:lipopolysaccharide transport system ATP-binding protein
MRPIIKVENLSKQYRIGVREAPYATLRESLTGAIRAPLKRLRRNGRSTDDTIWALKDVSFEVMPGEVVGIIGRNGAGKSTLLKILSRITEPTTGQAELYGRVGSLLEVGTGFHPELTGRDNIYLNGAILGMRQGEIKQKFDEIVAFAEVERFIDTPVKHYSTGMHVRLAFAVAAHLEPEILLVDEVLAVGDAAFQKKCLGKMQDVAQGGRTVLFVSHNMVAVQSLCTSACLFESGSLMCRDDVGAVIKHYYQRSQEIMGSVSLADRADRRGNGSLRFTGITVQGKNGADEMVAQTGENLVISLHYLKAKDSDAQAVIRLAFTDLNGQRLFMCFSRSSHSGIMRLPEKGQIRCKILNLPLLPGSYNVSLWCKIGEQLADDIQDAFALEVVAGDFFGTGKLHGEEGGRMLVSHSWEVSGDEDTHLQNGCANALAFPEQQESPGLIHESSK